MYAISVSHPDKVYRDRTVDFFNQHIEAAVQLDCDHMGGIHRLCLSGCGCRGRVWLVCRGNGTHCSQGRAGGRDAGGRAFTKYTTHICNEASQLRRLLRTVNSPRLTGLADTDVIATTAVDTFSTFLDVIGPENLGHVHFVDGNPGGHLVPGDGVLDLDGALEKLKAIHYTGALGLEVLDRRYVFAPEAAMKQRWTGTRKGYNARRAISDFTARFLWLNPPACRGHSQGQDNAPSPLSVPSVRTPRLIVQQPVQLCPLCRGVAVLILDGDAVDATVVPSSNRVSTRLVSML